MRTSALALMALAAAALSCGNLLGLDEFAPLDGPGQGGQAAADSGGAGGGGVGGAETVRPVWMHAFGEAGEDRGLAIAVDSGDHVIVAGTFQGEVSFGEDSFTASGPSDLFVVKLDSLGRHVWSKGFVGSGSELVHAMVVDHADRIVLVGEYSGILELGQALPHSNDASVFVAILDAQGVPVFASGYGDGSSQRALDVACDSQDNVIISGRASGSIEFGDPAGDVGSGGDDDDLFVAKLSPAGDPLWSRGFGDGADQGGQGVAVDSLDHIWITGAFDGSLDFGGTVLSADGTDLFVAKLDPDGQPVHAARSGSEHTQQGAAVSVGEQDQVFLTGAYDGQLVFGETVLETTGGLDVFLAELDATGVPVLGLGFEALQPSALAAYADLGLDVAVRGSTVALCGRHSSMVDFGGGPIPSMGADDAFVAAFDAGGSHRWSLSFGRYAADTAWAVAIDSAGAVVVAGDFLSALRFGNARLLSADESRDGFVLKFAP